MFDAHANNSHVNNVRDLFFYYVLGEHEGSRLLRRDKKDSSARDALIEEFSNITLLLSTDPSDKRHIDTLIMLSSRPQAAEIMRDGLEKYGGYLLKHIPDSYQKLKETYERLKGIRA